NSFFGELLKSITSLNKTGVRGSRRAWANNNGKGVRGSRRAESRNNHCPQGNFPPPDKSPIRIPPSLPSQSRAQFANAACRSDRHESRKPHAARRSSHFPAPRTSSPHDIGRASCRER